MTIEEMKIYIKTFVVFHDPIAARENMEFLADDQIKRLFLIVKTYKYKEEI